MFLFLYKNRLKCLLRDIDTVFWTLLFPIILATFFYLAFGNVMSASIKISPVAAAVIDSPEYRNNASFREALTAISSGKDRLINYTVLNEADAVKKLKSGEISGIITVSDKISLKVSKSGINESLLKAFLDEYIQTEKSVKSILSKNPSAAHQGLFEALGNHKQYTKEITLSGADPDTFLNYFYALIAMACLYGGFWGMRSTTDIQANLSPLGARRSIAPTHKLTLVTCDLLAAFTIHFTEILIAICYIIFVLGVDFGTRWALVILTCFIGSVTGVSFGTFIGSAFKKSEKVKNSILIGLSMAMCFLAGLMIVDIKQIIARNAPIVNLINPAALLTDAFYSLYVYDSLSRYFLNIVLLCLVSVLFTIFSYIFIRRERYDSI